MSTEAARTCLDRADDDEVVAEPGGLAIADVRLGDVIGASVRSMGRGLVDADGADHVRPRPLHELQIIGVIDDAGGVGVLEIDGQREMVLGADEAAAIGCVEIGIALIAGRLPATDPAPQIHRLTAM